MNIFRTINAGKSIRNEDQAAIYSGLLKTTISPDNIADKVADMMPTIPGYPQQQPVNSNKKPLNDNSKTTNSNDKLKSEIKTVENKPTGSSVVGKIDGDILNGKSVVELKHVLNGTDNPTETISADDLLSPSTPLPIEITLGEAANEVVESVYNTPLTSPTKNKSLKEESLPWVYFAVFDGHAGSGVAVAAANTLHKIIQEKLQSIADLLIAFGLKSDLNDEGFDENDICTNVNGSLVINQDTFIPKDNLALLFNPAPDKLVTVDSLIVGVLESAFWEFDNQIAADKQIYRMSGGCTACIGLFILGKLFVANAGDSRYEQ